MRLPLGVKGPKAARVEAAPVEVQPVRPLSKLPLVRAPAPKGVAGAPGVVDDEAGKLEGDSTEGESVTLGKLVLKKREGLP
ncbi:MAG: hypothetical protein Q8Q58_02675, partial [Candidatus Rokubacteria bacterium]|nr:hypothetical protein [Candidatus Rokubacteria bacterium]